MFKILRHLIRFIPKLPQQAAFALYNYIIGYVMFYTRTPHEEGQKLIGTALSLLWMVLRFCVPLINLVNYISKLVDCPQRSWHHVQRFEANFTERAV